MILSKHPNIVSRARKSRAPADIRSTETADLKAWPGIYRLDTVWWTAEMDRNRVRSLFVDRCGANFFVDGKRREREGRGEGTRLVCEDAERRCTGSPWNLRILSLNTFYLEVVVTKPTPLSMPRLLRYPPVDRCVSARAIGSARGNRFAPLWPLVPSSSIITIDPFTWIRLSQVQLLASLLHGFTSTYLLP